MNKKITAFTLQEMIVVLVLTTLVISISMVVLNLVQKQLLNITKNYALSTEIRLFERTLLHDMLYYDFTISEKTNELNGLSEQGSVVYLLDDNYILRNKDTIAIAISDKHFFLNNNEVYSGAIDAMDILINGKQLFFRNRKTATFYMEKLWVSN